jgi:hypothetical protein
LFEGKEYRSDLLVIYFYPSVILGKDKVDFGARCATCLLSCISILESFEQFSQNCFDHSSVFNVHGSVHCNNILIYIQLDATLHIFFYLETALHVSGGTTTHHQERIHLYLQHLVFVTTLLLSAAIVEELEPV